MRQQQPKQKVAEQIIFVAYEIPSHSGQMKLSEQLRLMKTTVTHTIVRASLVTYDSILTTYKDRKTNGSSISTVLSSLWTSHTPSSLVPIPSTLSLSGPVHGGDKERRSRMRHMGRVTPRTFDPVVSFTPVALAGVMVGKATGHNYNFVHDKVSEWEPS
jgi:NAD-dependent DNA ligase